MPKAKTSPTLEDGCICPRCKKVLTRVDRRQVAGMQHIVVPDVPYEPALKQTAARLLCPCGNILIILRGGS